MGLRQRCKDFFQSQQRDGMLRQGDPVQAIQDFVLAEKGRVEEVEDMPAVVLYFERKVERDDFVEMVLSVHPAMIARKVQ